ncbi:hypothetical protein AVEN_226631-1 [Araneus ventricosus]|uniref:Uncharacterized protein n=1 Tax=Araneus ventricosus TaxID=182803 RepID=A0A4Y2TX33_ARAVE|nr:hypothetical protein AVEN_226631-1 [Araneus ventricosus]
MSAARGTAQRENASKHAQARHGGSIKSASRHLRVAAYAARAIPFSARSGGIALNAMAQTTMPCARNESGMARNRRHRVPCACARRRNISISLLAVRLARAAARHGGKYRYRVLVLRRISASFRAYAGGC